MVFTTQVFAPSDYEQLQLAPEQDTHASDGVLPVGWAQRDAGDDMAYEAAPTVQTPAWPSAASIERCLINIRNLIPNLHVELDLGFVWYEYKEARTSVHANVLVALAASRMKLTTFSISQPELSNIDETMETLGFELSSPMRSLPTFSYIEESANWNSDDRSVISGLLGPPVKLRNLTLLLEEDDYLFHGSFDPVIPGVFRANAFTHLETLKIGYMNVNGVDLIATLSHCRCNLRRAHIEDVCVTESDDEWFRVFNIFTEMPRLSGVFLFGLGVVEQYHMLFKNLKHGHAYNGYKVR